MIFLPLHLAETCPQCGASPPESETRLVGVVEPFEGAMLTNNVRLMRRIAHGGMGSIWLARHLGLDLPVAVKFMSVSAWQTTHAALERFTREARTAARVRHPNVVQILDFGCSSLAGGARYIIMEYLEGEDLERYICEHGRLGLEEVVSIVLAVGSVLEKAHEQGIVHRDIKPGNVFLHGPDRVVKVFDFGVARDETQLSERTTEAGEIVGTPFFMSPEQVVGSKETDHRCDLWALGVLAYEALVGRLPFEGDTPTAVFLAITRGHYRTPSHVVPGLPLAVDVWFRNAFAADPARRFPSARAMAKALVSAVAVAPAKVDLELLPHRARHSSSLDRKWGGRSRFRSMLFVSAVASVTAFSGRSSVEGSSTLSPLVSSASLPPYDVQQRQEPPLTAVTAQTDSPAPKATLTFAQDPSSTPASRTHVRRARRPAPQQDISSFYFVR